MIVARLRGPMQAWGGESHYDERPTAAHLSRSGLVGLLANALGREREDDVSDLLALSVMTLSEGTPARERDFQTSRHLLRRGLRPAGEGKTALTPKQYLVDASFLVAIWEQPGSLREAEVAEALRNPARLLFLGRRAYPLSEPPLQAELSADQARALADATLATDAGWTALAGGLHADAATALGCLLAHVGEGQGERWGTLEGAPEHRAGHDMGALASGAVFERARDLPLSPLSERRFAYRSFWRSALSLPQVGAAYVPAAPSEDTALFPEAPSGGGQPGVGQSSGAPAPRGLTPVRKLGLRALRERVGPDPAQPDPAQPDPAQAQSDSAPLDLSPAGVVRRGLASFRR